MSDPQQASSEWIVTPTTIAVSLARHWRAVVMIPFVAALVAVVVLLLWPPTYTATASLVPEARQSGGSQLAGLAALVGVIPATAGGQSPQFYADLLRSRPIVYGVLQAKFARPTKATAGDSAQVLDILKVQGRTLLERLQRGRDILLNRVHVSVDARTGVISLSVENRYPALATAIADEFIAQLGIFNRDVRQSQARARRIFAEQRTRAAQADLVAAEDVLRRFLESNRQYANSPSLSFEHDRLERRVATAQELHLNLQRQLDAARIDEVNDLPVLTVIERPVEPTIKSGPRRRVLLATFLMFVVAVTVAGVVAYDVAQGRFRRALEYVRAEARPFLPGALARRL